MLLNGLPGVGKTTLAERYLADHPLALNLDIDALRRRMGHWETQDQSKELARSLAAAMALVHLRSGHDVVVPQLVARVGFIGVLEQVAGQAQAEFDEFLVRATPDDALARFSARRTSWAASGVRHPARTVRHDAATMTAISEELDRIVTLRPRTRVIVTHSGDVEGAYRTLLAMLPS